ncbi:MAG: Hint domain-containing protein [Pseudomonadota bacterium]
MTRRYTITGSEGPGLEERARACDLGGPSRASFASQRPSPAIDDLCEMAAATPSDDSAFDCFTPGTRIKTIRGEVLVEQLCVDDRVLTRDNGFQSVRWIGFRRLERAELSARPQLNPIEISPGALGRGLPERKMRVSPQHRMLIEGRGAQMYFGRDEVLVAAAHLTCLPGIRRVEPEEVTYIHILFDRHEIVLGDGAWSESFQPADNSLAGLDGDAREEILTLFPELEEPGVAAMAYPAARMTIKAKEAPLLFMQ